MLNIGLEKSGFLIFPCFLIVVLSSAYSLAARATTQSPDLFSKDGKEYQIMTYPLERFFDKHPEKRPKVQNPSTDLWRGYIASFEIKDNKLFVKDIKIKTCFSKEKGFTFKSVMSDIFPSEQTRWANWYSGYLIVPKLKPFPYIHEGYPNWNLVFTIENGVVLEETRMTDSQFEAFQRELFERYKKTRAYMTTLQEVLAEQSQEEELSNEQIEDIMDSVCFEDYTLILYKDLLVKQK